MRTRASRELRQSRHLRVPGRRRRRRATPRVRLHRGQSAPAGRAHGHRGGARDRSRAGRSSRSRAARRSPSSVSRRPMCRRRAALPCSCASTWRRWTPTGATHADRRHAHRVRPAVRSGRARRHVRLRRLPHQRAPSIRCSPRSSCIRPRLTSPTSCARRIARCASSASRVSRPTSRSCRRSDASGLRREPRQHRFHRERISPISSAETRETAELAARRRCRTGNAADDETPPLRSRSSATGPDGSVAVKAPLQGTIVTIDVEGRRPRSPRPADRGARIHEDGASGDAPPAAWCAHRRRRGRAR